MSRDSRVWQNPIAHARLFEGDVALCNEWYGWAQQKLKFMLSNTPGCGTMWFHPIDGVSIRVDTRPNAIRIYAGSSIYLENGFLSFGSSAICNELTFKPAKLHNNFKQSTYIVSTTTPIQGTVNSLFNGQQWIDATASWNTGYPEPAGHRSLAVGCPELTQLDTVTDECGNTYENGGYCDPALMIKKKKAQTSLPSSMFSGKMRLFVQALYGSKRTDYSYVTDGNYPYTLEIPFDATTPTGLEATFHLCPQYNNNTWLLTTVDYTYFVVRNLGMSLEFFELVPSSAGKTFLSNMLGDATIMANPDEIKRIETYVLSTCKPKPRHSIITMSGPSMYGSPLAYGWHVTWNGLEAHIVLMDEDYDNNRYNNTQYKITITPTLADGKYTFTAATEAIGDTAPWFQITAGITLIKPVYDKPLIDPGMYGVPKVHVGGGMGLTSYNAPCYVTIEKDKPVVWGLKYSKATHSGSDIWYDNPDIPEKQGDKISEVQYTVYGAGPSDFIKYSVTRDYLDVASSSVNTSVRKLTKIGNHDLSNIEYGGYWAQYTSIPLSNADLESGLGMSTYMITNGYWADLNGIYGTTAPKWVYVPGQYLIQYVGRHIFANANLYYSVVNSNDYGQIFLEIPYQDCNKVWYGKNKGYDSYNIAAHDFWAYGETSNSSTISNYDTNQVGWQLVEMRTSLVTGAVTYTVIEERFLKPYSINSYSQSFNTSSGNFTGGKDPGEMIVKESTGDITLQQSIESSNWHFYLDVNQDVLFIPSLEPWRSNTDGTAYTYSISLEGNFITKNQDFPGTSSVGWS